jgi:ribonuclease PH
MKRIDGRRPNQLRPVKIRRRFTRNAPGSVWVAFGDTQVLCTASIDEAVPAWRQGQGAGWVTAEYEMLPGSTPQRRPRSRAGKLDGRTQEIQRLSGRAMRAIVDLSALGERTIWIDCDVLQADGGTRTAAITGAFVALADAVAALRRKGLVRGRPITDQVAAVSVGLVGGRALLDLCYVEDKDAGVDFNVVMTGRGRFVEVQGAAEAGTFDRRQMNKLVTMGQQGVRQLLAMQKKALAGSAR